MLCARHPMLENFCVQHMIALSRAGRQSEALAAYRKLRAGMVEHLGVEPSHHVRHVHHAILAGQPLTSDHNLAVRR
jgi:DNA-binding SARP family transcriptional activator